MVHICNSAKVNANDPAKGSRLITARSEHDSVWLVPGPQNSGTCALKEGEMKPKIVPNDSKFGSGRAP